MAEAMPIEKNNIPIGLPIITSLGKKSLNQISKIKKIQNWLKIFCKKEVKKSFNISMSWKIWERYYEIPSQDFKIWNTKIVSSRCRLSK